jgi:hypothetical protein
MEYVRQGLALPCERNDVWLAAVAGGYGQIIKQSGGWVNWSGD